MMKIETDLKMFPNFIFWYKDRFQEVQVDFWTKKFTLKTENVNFMTSLPQVFLQDIKRSFEGAQSDAKTIEIQQPWPYYCMSSAWHIT